MGTISRKGLSPEWKQKESEKGRVMLEAMLAEARRDLAAAVRLNEQAAQMEEELAEEIRDRRELRSLYRRHAYSAASCWAAAGHLERALTWCEELLEDPGAPEPFRREVADFAASLRRQLTAAPSHLSKIAVPPRELAAVPASSQS